MNCPDCRGTGSVCPHGNTVMHHIRPVIGGQVQPSEQCWPETCGSCGGSGQKKEES